MGIAGIAHKSLGLNDKRCTFDDCLAVSLLKKLFPATQNATAPIQYTIHAHVADIKSDLTELNKANIQELSYSYYALLEATLPEVASRYVIIRKNGHPILFAYFQLFTLTSTNFNLENNSNFVKGILKFFVNLKKAKVVVLGSVLRNETLSYCYNTQELNSDDATEVIAGIAEKIAAQECATAIILKELPELSDATHKVLTANGYNMPFEDKVMDMTINPNWHSLKDYTEALSRKYKARANKVLDAANSLEVKLLTEKEIINHTADINRLFTGVVREQPFTLTQPGSEYFSALKKLYGEAFEVTGYFENGKMIAFYTAFIGKDYYNLYYVGFDYALNGTYQLYFNILFSGLERAILLQKQQLQLGRTSFDAKASLGAQARTLNYLIKMEYMPEVVIKWFVKYFSAMENTKWKQRTPLK